MLLLFIVTFKNSLSMACRFQTNFQARKPYRLKPGYSFDPVPGFQNGAAEDIGTLVARFRAGDSSGVRDLYSDDVYPFDGYVDKFDALDQVAYMEQSTESPAGEPTESNSVSSASGPEPALGEGSRADKPGDTEIASHSGDSPGS